MLAIRNASSRASRMPPGKTAAGTEDPGQKILASNRRAFHDFHLGERHEAGIVLLGTEVKALRAGKASLQDAFARIERGEIFLHHLHIPPYSHRGYADHDPLRTRKLLMHRDEILKLAGRARGGTTLIPLRLYLKGGRVKVEIAVARGKKDWDKRESEREREHEREARDARGRSSRGIDRTGS
jgi:SsrA-binding protein